MERRRIKRASDHRPRRSQELDLDDVIYGVHAVGEALNAGETLRRIHVGDERKRDPGLRGLLERAHELGVSVRYESRSFFTHFPYRAHQSVVAFGEPFAFLTRVHLRPVGKPPPPRPLSPDARMSWMTFSELFWARTALRALNPSFLM